MDRPVRITKASGNQRNGSSYKIGLPLAIGGALYDKGLFFVVELTGEGILFRPASTETTPIALPAWADGPTGTPKE